MNNFITFYDLSKLFYYLLFFGIFIIMNYLDYVQIYKEVSPYNRVLFIVYLTPIQVDIYTTKKQIKSKLQYDDYICSVVQKYI